MSDYLNGLGGYSLYRFEIDVKRSPQSALNASRQFLDDAGTKRGVATYTTNLPLIHSVSFTELERGNIKNLIEFFNTVRGRLKSFWWIVQQNLFTPASDYLLNQTVLAVEQNLFGENFRGYERIFLLLSSGDLLTFKVAAVISGLLPADPIGLQISAPLDRNLDIDEILIFGKLIFCRLDEDELKVKFSTSEIAETEIKLRELVEGYPA